MISRLDRQHTLLVNRNKIGSMVLPGESLFVPEMQPASYRMIGATGRVHLSGPEADVRQAAEAAVSALEAPAARAGP